MPLRGVCQQAVLRQQPPSHPFPRRPHGGRAAPSALTVDGVDRLYELPIDEFVAARDRLVKELRSGGDRAGAAEVKALRKPTRASWALNQVARRSPDVVDAVIAAGEDLLAAQAAALEGDAAELRPAMEAERASVEAAVEAAERVLEESGQGLGGGVMEKTRDTLRAAITDETARDQLRAGRLTEDLEPQGFGAGDRFPSSPGASARRVSSDDKREKALARARAEAERLQGEARAATARAEKLADEASAAEREAAERRTRADRAMADAEAAQAAASAAGARLTEAEDEG